MGDRAGETGESAIAGAIASRSDVVENGCQECPLSSARLKVWQTTALASDQAAAEAAALDPPALVIEAQGHYRKVTGAGFYLMCAPTRDCVPIEVTDGKTTTVNVELPYGPARFFLGSPGAPKPMDGFNISGSGG